MQILYEDPYLLLAEKDAGMPSQPDKTGDDDLLTLLRREQAARGDKYEAELAHRLDRGTGGVMLYAKGSAMAAKLSAMLGERRVEKEYLAVLTAPPAEPAGTFCDTLLHDTARNVSRVVPKGTKGAKDAVLRYETVAEADGLFLALVRLETGRTHQIRIQFASRGCPLSGDGKYGAKNGGALGLWSFRLTLPHPMHRKETVSAVSLPRGDAFAPFAEAIRALADA